MNKFDITCHACKGTGDIQVAHGEHGCTDCGEKGGWSFDEQQWFACEADGIIFSLQLEVKRLRALAHEGATLFEHMHLDSEYMMPEYEVWRKKVLDGQ